MVVERPGQGALKEVWAAVQWLMCGAEPDRRACGTCPACRKVDRLIHPDVHWVMPLPASAAKDMAATMERWRKAVAENPYMLYSDWMARVGDAGKQGNIAVQQVREMQRKAGLHATEGGRKVFVVWLAEYLGREGNILLKTLEEPPDDTFFFLITQRPEGVLATIRSRSLIYRMPLWPVEEFVAAAATLGVPADAARRLYEVVDGCPGMLPHVAGPEWEAALKGVDMWWAAIVKGDVWRLWRIADRLHERGRESAKSLMGHMLRGVRQRLHHGGWPPWHAVVMADMLEHLLDEVQHNMHIRHAVFTRSLAARRQLEEPIYRRLIA